MKLKSVIFKLLLITVFIAGAFALSSCFGCSNGCGFCSKDDKKRGVEYKLEEDGSAYYVSYIPHTTSDVVIKAEYLGKPVTRIDGYAFTEYVSYGCGGEYLSVSVSRLVVPASIKYVTHSVAIYGSTINEISYLGTLAEWCEIEGGFNLFTGSTRLMIGGALVSAFNAPESMTKIPCDLFNGYTLLSEVSLHNGVTEIGDRAFKGTGIKALFLPDNEYIGLGAEAFKGCNYLERVILPKGVKTIPESVFAECVSLSAVDIAGVIDELGASCFYGCEKLISIDFSAAAFTAIPEYAFAECRSMCSFIIPASVVTVDKNAFTGCKIYEFYNLSPFVSVDRIGNGVKDELVIVHKDLSEPSIVVVVGDFVFLNVQKPVLAAYVGNADEPTLPEAFSGGTYSLGSGLFKGYNFESVHIPDKVAEVGNSAFENCKRLVSVTGCGGLKTVGTNAFYGCDKLESVKFDFVTQIGDYAFAECKSLSSFETTAKINSVGRNAFMHTAALESVKLNAQILEYGAFEESGLVYADLNVETIDYYAFKNCAYLSEVILREGLLTLYSNAFTNCVSIKRLDFPATLENLGEQRGLTSLESVSVNENNARYKAIDGCVVEKDKKTVVLACKSAVIPNDGSVEIIGDYAFYGCSLSNVVLPESVKKIGHSAFEDGIFGSVIMTGVEKIGANAFKGCLELENVELSGNLTSISDYAFNGCAKLKSITLPDSVTDLGENVFVGCVSLEEVTLSKSITVIRMDTFAGCEKLKSIILPDSVTVLESGAFSGCVNLESVKFPENLTSIGGSAFADCVKLKSIILPDSVTVLESGAFSGCVNLESVKFPENLTSIGGSAFADCVKLKSITLPDSVMELGERVFSGCVSLEEVTLSNSLLVIPYRTFYDCRSLVRVVIPEGVKRIEHEAFLDCSALKEIVIPSTLQDIGEYAFRDCESLKTVYLPRTVYVSDNAFERKTKIIYV